MSPMKKTSLFGALFFLMSAPLFAHNHDDAAPRPLQQNNCDRLVNPTSEALANCLARFGTSEYRRDLERRMAQADDDARAAANRVLTERDLLESETFTRADLDEAFFNQKVIIARVDNRNPDRLHETFSPDLVCQYLGYAKAADVRVGAGFESEIWSDYAGDEGGIILNRQLDFEPYKARFLQGRHLVKPLERITCFKTRDGSTAALRHVPQGVISVMNLVQNRTDNRGTNVDDGPRRRGETPAHYNEFLFTPSSRATDR